jgi:RND family efflux transporter MFP subunit
MKIIFGIALMAASIFASAADNNSKPTVSGTKPTLTVNVIAPKQIDINQQVTANGSIAAWQEAIVGSEANGLIISEIRVNVGQRVRRGEVIAVLKSDTLQAELAQAEGTLAEALASALEARSQTDRAKSLQKQGFFSDAQLSQTLAADAVAQARVQSARALVQLQSIRLSQTQVRSPDDGVISARQASVGSVVNAGTELFRLIRQGRLEWRAEISATDIGRIKIGAPVKVTAASGQVLQGRVRTIAPAMDAQTRNALAYVDLPEQVGSARAGMYAKGDILLGQNKAMAVPQTAVVVRDGFSYVYTVGSDNKVTQIKVQTGRLSGDQQEILVGLKPDARVVVSGGAFLNSGDTVRIVNSTATNP